MQKLTQTGAKHSKTSKDFDTQLVKCEAYPAGGIFCHENSKAQRKINHE